MLQLRNFSYVCNGKTILEDIGFSLSSGAYLSIIGPNGAGKSTLLKSLLRLHEDGEYGGSILLEGRELAAYSQRELARIIAYVPQAGGWVPPYTVEEFLKLSRYPYSSLGSLGSPLGGGWREEDRAAVRRALCLTGTEGFAGRLLSELSGGERQRAFIAAALAQESRIMLLDEPTAFLDPKHAADLAALFKKLNHGEGLTMLVVTHDLNQPLDAGGQVLVLRRGRQLFFGPAGSLMEPGILEETYKHRFTRFHHPQTGRPVILPEPGDACEQGEI